MRASQDEPTCIIYAKDVDDEENDDFEMVSNIDGEIELLEIKEWKHKWEPEKAKGRRGGTKDYGYVTYKLLKGKESDSFPDSSFEHKALAIALRQWGLRTRDIRFKRLYKESETADIEVKFQKREDNHIFKENKHVLAYAYFPNGRAIGGDMVFNDSIFWSKDGKPRNAHDLLPETYPDPKTRTTLKTYNLVHVMLHEGGHALGLQHQEECKECMMYPYYSGKVVLHDEGDRKYLVHGKELPLTKEAVENYKSSGYIAQPIGMAHDVDRIQSFYGKRTINQRIVDYFRRRMLRKWN